MKTKKNSGGRKLATSIAPLILLVIAAGTLIGSANGMQTKARQIAAKPAAPVTAGSAAASGAPVAPGTFRNVFTLADIGTPDTIELRGVDSQHAAYFALPETEVVKSATMHIRYHFSPGLIPALSHLKVMINGTLFATLPVVTNVNVNGNFTRDGTGTILSNEGVTVTQNGNSALLEADLQIPADMLTRNNEVNFEFIGHYTLQCEDPAYSTLWARVDNTTTITLAGDLLPLQNELKLLPLPFYDSAVHLHPIVPIVFLSDPSPKALQAAGIIASWFGVLTNDHPVRFPVTIGTIPAGNVVIISENSSQLPAGLAISNASGPTVAIRNNPSDPYSKALVLTADDADGLVKAAQAVANTGNFLHGESMQITSLTLPAKSTPDDAPRWLSTDRRTTLKEITNQETLQGDGSVPIPVYLRVPPDLYLPDMDKNLSFHLWYRYNPMPLSDASSLQIYFNNGYVNSTPLPHMEKATEAKEEVVPVPVVDLRPFSNSILMKFFFQIAKKNQCQDTAPLNQQGAILGNSYLDLTGIPHWAVMPNLELFANAGFPFTRMADLSETTVVMPDKPANEEIEMFLTFMGHFGAETGLPVLRLTVGNTDSMHSGSTQDFLVFGTVNDQPALGKLSSYMPVTLDADGVHVKDTQGFFSAQEHAWWKVKPSEHITSGDLQTAGSLPDTLIEGIESPYASGHSIVVVAVKDSASVGNFLTAFLRVKDSSDIANTVSVLHGNRFDSFRIGSSYYHIGYLNLLLRMDLFFKDYSWMLVLAVVLVCFLMAVWLRVYLRRRARRRLAGRED